MHIVLPILFFAVVFGLFTPQEKVQRYRWVMVIWIVLVLARYWMKN